MKQNIKMGVIGSNFVSDWMCESIAESDGIEVAAVYSRTLEKGREFAEKHSIPEIYTDIDKFMASEIDGVYIASPNFLHYPYAKKAVLNGKHVLLEKPVCLNEQQFSSLMKLADENHVIVMEAMRPVHDTALSVIKENLKKVVTVRRSMFDFCQYSSRYDRFRAGEIMNAFNPSLGNAALMDIGVYAVSVCAALYGMPEEIYAKSVILPNGMEGMGTAVLQYQTHQAEIVYSKITESATPSYITGEDGSIIIGKLSTFDKLSLKKRGSEAVQITPERPDNNMIFEISDFVSCINGRMSAECFTQISFITLRIMDEIRRQTNISFPTENEI